MQMPIPQATCRVTPGSQAMERDISVKLSCPTFAKRSSGVQISSCVRITCAQSAAFSAAASSTWQSRHWREGAVQRSLTNRSDFEKDGYAYSECIVQRPFQRNVENSTMTTTVSTLRYTIGKLTLKTSRIIYRRIGILIASLNIDPNRIKTHLSGAVEFQCGHDTFIIRLIALLPHPASHISRFAAG